MIVYGECDHPADPRTLLLGGAERLRRLAAQPRPAHDALRAELIRLGEMEAAAGDALCPEVDGLDPRLQELRRISIQFGRLFWRSWRDRWDGDARARLAAVAADLDGLVRRRWPPQVRLRPAEGYAHYALYPESYGEAAASLAAERSTAAALVIGIRSIGTSLSAVVGGALMEAGIDIESWCVRPHGHPFSRSLTPDAGLSAAWQAAAQARLVALVVDEGPGLSGSSFLAVLATLRGCGFADHQVVLMPSWDAPAPPMADEAAAQAWQQARKRVAAFDPSPRMLDIEGPMEDLSAGRWRSILLPGRSWPAVQRQHERRKYLADGKDGGRRMWKFTGLGPHGEPRYARARALAEAGFIPAVRGLRNGFLVQDFVTGTPLRARDLDRRLAERVVAYLAFRARSFCTGRAARIADLREMIRVNVSEGLGAEWGDAAERALSSTVTLAEAGTIAVDSRMMPHEWLDTSRGLMKADAIDHADDHFFPRDQDVAWDIAGCAAEFRLTPEREWELCEAVAAATGDRELPRRIGFYAVAYRAFHLGYAELAISALGAEDADAARFRRRAATFSAELRSRLGAAAAKSRGPALGNSSWGSG